MEQSNKKDDLLKAAQWIKHSDAILIGGGAGLSFDSGKLMLRDDRLICCRIG